MTEREVELLNRYLDGVITEGEMETLEGLLRRDAEARSMLRSFATIDAKWQQLLSDQAFGAVDDLASMSSGEGPVDQKLSEKVPSTTAELTGGKAPGETSGAVNPRRLAPLLLSLTALAASMAFFWFGWWGKPAEALPAFDQGIARVIRIEGEGTVGVNRNRNLVDGSELFAGEELIMARGLVELAFRETGVHVVATAPLAITLQSDERVSLSEGQVKLVVPPQGVGFVVDTAQRKFVDLGTSFVVTANPQGSEVLVLDGQISVGEHESRAADLMHEGEFARFDQNGDLATRSKNLLSVEVPELASDPLASARTANVLRGTLFGFDASAGPRGPALKRRPLDDLIGETFFPLIRSGFKDASCVKDLVRSSEIAFQGIAGAYSRFPERAGIPVQPGDAGWMAWYAGTVSPPRPGRYRFWGYADNHLLVSINGKPVFEGSRYDSSFKKLGIPRTDNPSLPCLIARAGFASGEWVELNGDPVQLDLLFGEVGGQITSGLLLVEREGGPHEETFWGQPKWPLFLTSSPTAAERSQFDQLGRHLEEKMMGAFTVSEAEIWQASSSDPPR